MDKKYWENYYKGKSIIEEPSLFAQECLKKQLKNNDFLIELGCGTGRDAVFFAKHLKKVVAIDQSAITISNLKQNISLPNIEFICDDFTKTQEIDNFNVAYARFTMHAITEKQETSLIKWISSKIKPKGLFLIEGRSTNNELYGKGFKLPNTKHVYIYNKHKRRFLECKTLTSKLNKYNFTIIECIEKKGFSPTNQNDETFVRIIAEKL